MFIKILEQRIQVSHVKYYGPCGNRQWTRFHFYDETHLDVECDAEIIDSMLREAYVDIKERK